MSIPAPRRTPFPCVVSRRKPRRLVSVPLVLKVPKPRTDQDDSSAAACIASERSSAARLHRRITQDFRKSKGSFVTVVSALGTSASVSIIRTGRCKGKKRHSSFVLASSGYRKSSHIGAGAEASAVNPDVQSKKIAANGSFEGETREVGRFEKMPGSFDIARTGRIQIAKNKLPDIFSIEFRGLD